MRLGISTSLWGMNPHEWAEKMSEIGCKAVVFPVDCNADEKLIDEYVREAAEHELLIAEVGIWRNALDSDLDTLQAHLDRGGTEAIEKTSGRKHLTQRFR